MSQDNFDELCRRLLAGEPKQKDDWDLIYSLICYGAWIAIIVWLIWAWARW